MILSVHIAPVPAASLLRIQRATKCGQITGRLELRYRDSGRIQGVWPAEGNLDGTYGGRISEA